MGFLDENYGTYAAEYYNNAADVASAANIVVAAATTVGGINASLAALGGITGTVTGPDGSTPLEDIEVRVYVWDAEDGYWYSTRSTYTQPDGSYSLGGLNANSYRLRFYDEAGSYTTEYYNNALNLASSTNIVVGTSATVSGINASLAPGSRITGTVTKVDGVSPLEDIYVYVYSADGSGGWDWVRSAYTRADGSYSLGGLAAGTYRVGFFDYEYYNHVPEYYNNKATIASATDIVVGVAAVVGGIDASLEELGRITGTVTGPDGTTPLEDVEVYAYGPDGAGGWRQVKSSYTRSNGGYAINGLAAGTYRLRFFEGGNYAEEYYNNAPNIASAANIVVGVSATVSGINASMSTTPPAAAPEIAVEYTSGGGLVDNGAARNMGTVTVGGTGNITTFRIRNLGNQNLTGIAVSASGGHPADIVLGLPAVSFLAPGAHTDFTVAFRPKAGGARSASIRIASNDADENPFDIPLVGTGAMPPAPEIAVSQAADLADGKSTIDFKTAKVKKSVVVKTFTIRNLGKAPLSGLKIATKGGQSSDFVPGKLKTSSLAPGASATFKVTFKPSGKGNRATVLLVSSNDADENPFEIRLKGKGKKTSSSAKASGAAATTKETPREPLVGEDLIEGRKYRTLTVLKSPPGGTVAGTVEVSSNLVDWFSGRDHTTVVANNERYYKVRDNIPASKELKRFIRLKTASN